MKSSFRLGWEEWQAALRERERVQVQQLEAQFNATRLAERAAELEKHIEQILARAGKLAFMQEWEELQAAQQERKRVQAQLFEAQWEARRLAKQVAEHEKYIQQNLAGEISKSNQCESHRERESNEVYRQTENQLC